MASRKSNPVAGKRFFDEQRRDVDVFAEEALGNNCFGISVAGSAVANRAFTQRHAAQHLIVDQRVQTHERACPAGLPLVGRINAANPDIGASVAVTQVERASVDDIPYPADKFRGMAPVGNWQKGEKGRKQKKRQRSIAHSHDILRIARVGSAYSASRKIWLFWYMVLAF
jgi:hypothetical protein